MATLVRTRAGAEASAYSTKSTESMVEDTGTAQLVAGSAMVRLDPNFAQSIDLGRPYRVFLTPDGDTRGLFVAQKSATSFIVRETQGGRNSLSFDYRIIADEEGHATDRMALLTPASKAKLFHLSSHTMSPLQFAALAKSGSPLSTAPKNVLKAGDPFARPR